MFFFIRYVQGLDARTCPATQTKKEKKRKRKLFKQRGLDWTGPNRRLAALAPDTTSQLDILGHNGDSFGVDGAQVGVLEERDQVGFRGFL